MKSEQVIRNRIDRLKKSHDRFFSENMEQCAYDVRQLIHELYWVIQTNEEKENG